MHTVKVRLVSVIAMIAMLSSCNRNGDLFLTPAPAPTDGVPDASPFRSMLVGDWSELTDGGVRPTQMGTAQPSAAPEAQGGQPAQAQGERVHVMHVLISHTESIMRLPSITRSKEQAREFAATLLQRARNGEDFASLARQYSDEPGHESKAGDLGFIVRGQTVEPFERAAFALSVGAISDVVETQFGFHIIKRIE
jgi:hypothetical protein